jgi:hypothetical protein
MINVKVDTARLASLTNVLKEAGKGIGREVAIALNGTSKKCSVIASRALAKELPVPSKIRKKAVRPGIKADAKTLSTTITLAQGHPIPLKYFLGKVNPRLTKRQRAAVGKGFIVGRYKGHVFKRATNKRGPLVRQDGPAPGDAFERAGIAKVTADTARTELPLQVERRIRFWKLKLAGQLRGNQR